MAKNIVLLSDGTGNSAGKFFKTNVWRLYQALDLSQTDAEGRPTQIAYYHDGVGSSSFKPMAMLGGAVGWGLKRNVIDLYTYLCRNYKDKDCIYGFGFSRGAFTIRVLTGLINSEGLVKAESEAELRQLATDAFRVYRRKKYETLMRLEKPGRVARDLANFALDRANRAVRLRKAEVAGRIPRPPIQFLGLWDTVSAYGLPFDELTRAWDWVFPLSIPDREPFDRKFVLRACHALALDDERNTFHPVLWNEEALEQEQGGAKRIEDEKVSQVWFAGMHAGVGGGYPDDALANVSLEWIMVEAENAGLKFKADAHKAVAEASDVHGKLYDSRQGLGGGYRYLPRKLEMLTNAVDDRKNRVVIKRPKIHESVLQRIKDGADAYAPIVLPASYAVVGAADGAIQELPPGGATSGLLENRRKAEERVILQEKAWDFVWWRRVVYFSAVFVAGALLFFPLIWPALDACESRLCGISWTVRAVGEVLPAAAAPWIDAWETRPVQFFRLLIVFVILLLAGGWLRVRISDEMRAIWKRLDKPPMPDPRGWLYRMRTSRFYQWLWKSVKWAVLPAIAGIAAIYLMAAGASQALFALMNATGAVCAPAAAPVTSEVLKDALFTTDSVCWASGYQVQEGVRYRVTLQVGEPWVDGSIPTGVAGFGRRDMTPAMHLGLPFRRHLGEHWFKPIVRIGARGSDEYPLNPSDALNPDKTGNSLIAEFTARRDGELFLFVNDAVFPVPASWQFLYSNNKGSATVTITPRGVRFTRPAAKPAK